MAVRGKKPIVIVLGRMCHDAVGGAVWHFLNYLLGFSKLGFETYYVEWGDKWVPDPLDPSSDPSFPRVMAGEVLERYGFGGRWICKASHVAPGFSYGPLSPDELPHLFKTAEALVNVSGTHVLNDEQLECPRRVYLETDPGIPQIRLAEGDDALQRILLDHTHLFTFAENIHNPDCRLPDTSMSFRTTRQAVDLAEWVPSRAAQDDSRKFTTIAKWSKKGKDIAFEGDVFRWSKKEQFFRYLDLPGQCDAPLELALSMATDQDRAVLEKNGWKTTDALALSSSVDTYRDYIHHSRGEFTIAKDQYVRLRTGWFSDRSACYLAAGRPVITQDTGFGTALPTGEGLFAHDSVDDAIEALESIESDYQKHSDSAREIAREYFAADRVLEKLLDEIGLARP